MLSSLDRDALCQRVRQLAGFVFLRRNPAHVDGGAKFETSAIGEPERVKSIYFARYSGRLFARSCGCRQKTFRIAARSILQILQKKVAFGANMPIRGFLFGLLLGLQ